MVELSDLLPNLSEHSESWRRLQQLRGRNKLPHAMGFAGANETSLFEIAWRLAQSLVCEGVSAPCGRCGPCQRMESRQVESVKVVEPEGATIKIDQAHSILSFLSLRRLGRARVVIIRHAQLLNPQAANALLKVIEEPPAETFFILLAEEFSQLLPTLRSRCQVIRFARTCSHEPVTAEVQQKAMTFLTDGLRGERSGLSVALEQARDRESAQALIQVLQEILRDWTVELSGAPLKLTSTTAWAKCPEVTDEVKAELWQSAFQMELDLAANVDRLLIFENFYLRLKNAQARGGQ